MEQFTVVGDGSYQFDIVGEASYQKALARITGGKKSASANHKADALIVPEDANRFDPLAVKVVIGDQTVGYFDRESAREYRKRLTEAGATGATVSCRAKVVGGWKKARDDEGHFGVKLDLPAGKLQFKHDLAEIEQRGSTVGCVLVFVGIAGVLLLGYLFLLALTKLLGIK